LFLPSTVLSFVSFFDDWGSDPGGGGDGVFAYDEYRSKNLRAHFVESSAIVIQTAFRAYRARRDVGKVLREQREKLRKMKGDEAAAITIQVTTPPLPQQDTHTHT